MLYTKTYSLEINQIQSELYKNLDFNDSKVLINNSALQPEIKETSLKIVSDLFGKDISVLPLNTVVKNSDKYYKKYVTRFENEYITSDVGLELNDINIKTLETYVNSVYDPVVFKTLSKNRVHTLVSNKYTKQDINNTVVFKTTHLGLIKAETFIFSLNSGGVVSKIPENKINYLLGEVYIELTNYQGNIPKVFAIYNAEPVLLKINSNFYLNGSNYLSSRVFTLKKVNNDFNIKITNISPTKLKVFFNKDCSIQATHNNLLKVGGELLGSWLNTSETIVKDTLLVCKGESLIIEKVDKYYDYSDYTLSNTKQALLYNNRQNKKNVLTINQINNSKTDQNIGLNVYPNILGTQSEKIEVLLFNIDNTAIPTQATINWDAQEDNSDAVHTSYLNTSSLKLAFTVLNAPLNSYFKILRNGIEFPSTDLISLSDGGFYLYRTGINPSTLEGIYKIVLYTTTNTVIAETMPITLLAPTPQ